MLETLPDNPKFNHGMFSQMMLVDQSFRSKILDGL